MLPDVLDYNLRLVICGTAVGLETGRTSMYYANTINQFWSTLHKVGITDITLDKSQFRLLLKYGVGLTNLIKGQSGNDVDIQFLGIESDELKHKIKEYQPLVLCFNGKQAAKQFYGSKQINYGFQKESDYRTKVFVAPSTSGSARRWWNISFWHELATICGYSCPK